jgi:hypothetical protein
MPARLFRIGETTIARRTTARTYIPTTRLYISFVAPLEHPNDAESSKSQALGALRFAEKADEKIVELGRTFSFCLDHKLYIDSRTHCT